MDGRGKRARGRPRRQADDARSEELDNEIPVPREQNRADYEARIIEAYERGRQAAEMARGAHVVPQEREAEEFRRLFDVFGRLAPSKFSGNGIEAAEEWLADIKAKFRVCRVPGVHQVELATHYLENAARFWWENMKLGYEEDPEQIPWTWFEEKFKEEYVGMLQQEALRQQFITLKQEGQTVAEYNTTFVNLSRYAPDIRGNPYRYTRQYISGLRPRIAAVVDNPTVREVRELMRHAAQVEVHQKREREQMQERNVRQKSSKGPIVSKGKEKASSSSFTPAALRWCRICNQPHDGLNCPVRNRACFVCGKTGHWKRECPQLKQEERNSGQGSRNYSWGGGRTSGPYGSRGGGRNGDRGRGRDGSRGGGQSGGRGGGRMGVNAVNFEYVDPNDNEKETEIPPVVPHDELLSGIVSVSGYSAFTLFDTGCSHSVISQEFVKFCGWETEVSEGISGISTPLGQFSSVVLRCNGLKVLIAGKELEVNVLVLDIIGYDLLLGLDWLTRYNAVIECAKRRILFRLGRPSLCTLNL